MKIQIPKKTPVIVRWYIKGGIPRDPVSVWDPLPASEAIQRLTTSSGTVAVDVTVASGEYAGAGVSFKGGKVFARVPELK